MNDNFYNRFEITDDGNTVVGYLNGGHKFYFDIDDYEKVMMDILFGEFSRLNDVPPAPEYIESYVYEKCMPYIEAGAI